MAWRVWVAGAVLDAIVSALIFVVAPAQYRAQATVLVDQNVEQALPPDTSGTDIYIYLQRETDKLIVIAWADAHWLSWRTRPAFRLLLCGTDVCT